MWRYETMQTNHYGATVDSETPTTGVFGMNNLGWIGDDMFGMDAIDLAWEDHLAECKNEDHDHCGPQESGTILIGFMMGEDGKYIENPDAEYSAICGEVYVQVTRSKYALRCALCSPCYPGQGDADSPGEFLCYSVPPEVVGDCDDELRARILVL
jgi:hypothetical protein